MKKIHGLGLVVVFVVTILSCTKDKIVPTVAETNGAILAGAKGSSKSWKMSSATGTSNGGAEQSISLDACLLDNIYTFSNNSLQDYENTEGLTKCNSTDSLLIEKGSWALTIDGKSLLIDGTPYSPQNLFTALGESLTVVKLTDATMKLSFSYTDGSNNQIVIYLNFVKV